MGAMRTLGVVVAVLGCLSPSAGATGGTEGGVPAVQLTDVATTAGLLDTLTTGNTHTGGAAWVDYNGDYWPDLFIGNGSGLQHKLYRNDGDGTFTDVSFLVAKPDVLLEDSGILFGDIDNDGDEDIVVIVDNPVFNLDSYNVPEGGPDLLYRNQGDGTFVEEGAAAGIVDPRGWRNICGGLADYDRDGLLDLYIGTWQKNNLPEEGFEDDDRTLHNDGDGTFTDSTLQTRIDGFGRDALVCLWFDANLDGWPDLYVGNIGDPGTALEPDNNDIFYYNLPGKDVFRDFTGDPHRIGDDAKASMGMDVADVDADGDFDLYITDIIFGGAEPFGNVLYLGNPDGQLTDNVADVAGVSANSSWPCNFADFDLDGWADLFVGTGMASNPDYLYLNNQDGTFTDQALPSLIGNEARGSAQADYDGDGDVDLFVWDLGSDCKLYQNQTTTAGHWLELKLFGQASNRSAIGAVVHVDDGDLTQMRRVSGGDSAHSESDHVVHFGLAAATLLDVTIDWPSGQQQVFTGVDADQLLFVDESAGLLPEQLTLSLAWYSRTEQTLLVVARSNYGGRTQLQVDGLGALAYDAEKVGHKTVFTGVTSNPGSITISSSSGASFVVPVTPVP